MGVMAFPYTAVLDVTANTLLGNNTGSAAAAQALTASQVRTLCSLYSTSEVDTLLAGKAASSHTHGNITNAGAIGSTSGVPIITGTSGVLEAGSFGSTSGTFCQGNDSRLSDARTPTAHKTTHATGGTDALTAADIGAAATSHTHAASDITSGTIATARLASGTASASTYLRGDQTWATVTAGVGGSTGATDNILLRSDGTGGSTLQNSNWSVPDIYTASPNATVNHLSLQATGSSTSVSVSIVPKGTGAFLLAVPDGTATGGNARGANAVDLQTSRGSASSVASGSGACILGGYNNVASGSQSFAGGYQNTASAQSSFAFGTNSAATSNVTCAIGQSVTASGYASQAFGFAATASGWFSQATGFRSSTAIPGSKVHAAGYFAADGDTQEFIAQPLRATTTDGVTAVSMFANSTDSATASGIAIASGQVVTLLLQITGVKNGGGSVARFTREVTIKNVGGTTSLVGTVNTVGTDNASGTSVSVTADDTNDKLQIAVTGVAAETWRWQCISRGGQISFG